MNTFKFWSPDEATGVEAGRGTKYDDGTVVTVVYGPGDVTYTVGHDTMDDVYEKLAGWPAKVEVVWD